MSEVKFNNLSDIEEEYDINFEESDKVNEQLILDIFNEKIKPNNNLFAETSDGYIEYIFGLYYDQNDDTDDNMIKYYEESCKKGNVIAMYELGHYYEDEEDYTNMIKYYLMAIEKDDVDAMCNLGCYYQEQEDYVNMTKYFLMAIEKGDESSMNNLANYYYDIKDDDENAIKYWLMAIEKNSNDAINNLADYYRDKDQIDNMMKYYNMGIEKGDNDSLFNLGSYYEDEEDYDNMKKYYLEAIDKEHDDAMLALSDYYYKKIHSDLEIDAVKNMLKYAIMAIDYNDDYLEEFEDKCKEIFKNYNYVMHTELNKIEDKTDLINDKIRSLKKKMKKNKKPETYEILQIENFLGRTKK